MTTSFARLPVPGETPQQALRVGRKFWRYYGAIATEYIAGNLAIPYFEVPVGVKAIAIGPQSDLDMVTVIWNPPRTSDELLFTVDVRNPLIMDLPVNPTPTRSSPFLGATTNGSLKILPYFFPPLYQVSQAGLLPPFLDLLFYFDTNGAQIPRGRPDGGGQAGQTSFLDTSETLLWTTLAYGRKQINWELTNLDTGASITSWRFIGGNYFDNGTTIATTEHQISPAYGGASAVIAAGESKAYVLNGTRFNYYKLYATGDGAGDGGLFDWRYRLID
jgi:hypothetical protein